MTGKFRSMVTVLVGVAALSTLSVTEASATSEKTTSNQEHHSRTSKAAFWRHHKHQDKIAKPVQATPQKTEVQKTQTKTPQLKPVSAKETTGASSQKRASASKVTKSSTEKTSAATKTKSSQKMHDGQTSSVKQ